MPYARIVSAGAFAIVISGCQSWQTQDVTKLPPTAALPAASEPGKVQVYYWDGISGGKVVNLTESNLYPDQPSEINELTSLNGPEDRANNFGSLVRGYIQAPSTGQYRFFVSGDAETQFWLSTSNSPAEISLIASVPLYVRKGNFTQYASQTSGSISLEKGEKYYFELRHKDGSGGDHFTVDWEGPGFSQQVVDGNYLYSWAGSAIGDLDDAAKAYSLGYRVGYLDGTESLPFNQSYPPLDNDNDGLYDNWEVVYNLDPNDPTDANKDLDEDFLSATDEFGLGTAENNQDSDGDGIPDGAEFAYGLNPLDPSDATEDLDGDGISNLDEYNAGSNFDDPSSVPGASGSNDVLQTGLAAQFFKGTNFDDFVLTRVDKAIHFEWGRNQPIPEVPADQFSVRWSGLFTPPHDSGTRQYRFVARTDDGVRLYLNGNRVVDDWSDHGAKEFSYTISAAANETIPFTMEYYDNDYGAIAHLNIIDLESSNTIPLETAFGVPDPAAESSADTDNDGIPDNWELRYGLNPWKNDAQSVSNDDGITNIQAYESGLQPWTLTSVSEPDQGSPETTVPDASPGTVTLSWTAPSTRLDGTSISLSEIDYYEISYGKTEGKLDQTQRASGELTSFELENLSPGTWYFTIKVVDDQGLTSAPSEEVSQTIQ